MTSSGSSEYRQPGDDTLGPRCEILWSANLLHCRSDCPTTMAANEHSDRSGKPLPAGEPPRSARRLAIGAAIVVAVAGAAIYALNIRRELAPPTSAPAD